jgi:hypothetical protein
MRASPKNSEAAIDSTLPQDTWGRICGRFACGVRHFQGLLYRGNHPGGGQLLQAVAEARGVALATFDPTGHARLQTLQ